MKRKVAYILGCYNKFNDIETAQNSVAVLKTANLEVSVFDLGCCGMPFIGIGNLESARRNAASVSKKLEELIGRGNDVVLSCPSCGTMIKLEYPRIFKQLENQEFQTQIYNLGEYLKKIYETGEWTAKFSEFNINAGYQISCHLKAQKIGTPFVDLFKRIPGLKLKGVFDNCCGMAGTMGYKKEKYHLSEMVGGPLIEEIKRSSLNLILSDCASCQSKINHELGVKTVHPISILRRALQAGN